MKDGEGSHCNPFDHTSFGSPRSCAVRVAAHEAVRSTTSRCETSSPTLAEPQYKTCALVSSSGTLLGSGCGKEIDHHEAIWRMNSPVVEGFEPDVGARTDFNVMMSWPVRIVAGPQSKKYEEAAAVSQEIPGSRFPSVPHSSPPRPLDLLNATGVCSGGCGAICDQFLCANSSRWNARGFLCASNLFNDVLADFQHSFPRGWSRSTGLRTAFVAGALCSQVTLYGFEQLQHDQPYHYWEPVAQNENSPDVLARNAHHMDMEHLLLDSLSQLDSVPLCRTLDPRRSHPKSR